MPSNMRAISLHGARPAAAFLKSYLFIVNGIAGYRGSAGTSDGTGPLDAHIHFTVPAGFFPTVSDRLESKVIAICVPGRTVTPDGALYDGVTGYEQAGGSMTSIGETLRGERLRRHKDIEAISRELKIPAKFLEAIESEQFDRLPAAVFARSFVRQYARYLGLHEEEMVEALQRLTEAPPSMAESPAVKGEPPAIQMDRMAEWESVGERRSWWSSLPALALLVVAMLGCSGVYAWWQRNRHAVSAHEDHPAAMETARTAAPGQALAATPASTPAAKPVLPPNSAAEGASDRSAAAPEAEKPGATPGTAGTASQATATPGPPGPVHVQVTASSLVWVMAKADDKTSFTGTLEANQSRIFDAQHTVVVRLGNAAGAEITLNGKSIGTIGPSGQPRTVQFTPNGFQIVQPQPKPPDIDPLKQ